MENQQMSKVANEQAAAGELRRSCGTREREKEAEKRENFRFEISDCKVRKEAEKQTADADSLGAKKPWIEPVVTSFEQILERVPRARLDGRYFIPGAREILADYWLFVSLTNRRPTRKEFHGRRPRWEGFFSDFRDLERVTGVIFEKTKKGWKRRGGGKWLGKKCGLPLVGRSMLLEPVNEQGVVLLFGEMARELGFVIERVGTEFPDCVAAKKVGGEWKTVRIEFEFLSSRFDHDPAGCDLVVCWEHDWKGCPVEVMELKGKAIGPGHLASGIGHQPEKRQGTPALAPHLGGGICERRRQTLPQPLPSGKGLSELREPEWGECRIEKAASGRR